MQYYTWRQRVRTERSAETLKHGSYMTTAVL